MFRISHILTSSLALFGVSAASAVLDLTPDNFDEIVFKSGKPSLVEFFAPWCGHCKSLAPVYEDLASSFEYAKDKVVVAKVDADAHKDLGRRFGVQGFPTLKWFDGKSETPTDYSKGRDIDSLTAFILDNTGLKAKTSNVQMLSDTTFAKEIGGDKDVLVAFTAPWCGHCKSLAPIWEDLANDFVSEPNVLVAKVDAEAPNAKRTAEEQGVKSYPTIKFFPRGSTEPEPYSGAPKKLDLISFLNEKAGTHRVAGGKLDATAGTIAALDRLVTRYTGNEEAIAAVAKDVQDAAATLKDKYAEYYVKVFDKVAKNKAYVEKETTRLDNLVKKGALAPEKMDDLVKRRNILAKFRLPLTGEKQEL